MRKDDRVGPYLSRSNSPLEFLLELRMIRVAPPSRGEPTARETLRK